MPQSGPELERGIEVSKLLPITTFMPFAWSRRSPRTAGPRTETWTLILGRSNEASGRGFNSIAFGRLRVLVDRLQGG